MFKIFNVPYLQRIFFTKNVYPIRSLMTILFNDYKLKRKDIEFSGDLRSLIGSAN